MTNTPEGTSGEKLPEFHAQIFQARDRADEMRIGIDTAGFQRDHRGRISADRDNWMEAGSMPAPRAIAFKVGTVPAARLSTPTVLPLRSATLLMGLSSGTTVDVGRRGSRGSRPPTAAASSTHR